MALGLLYSGRRLNKMEPRELVIIGKRAQGINFQLSELDRLHVIEHHAYKRELTRVDELKAALEEEKEFAGRMEELNHKLMKKIKDLEMGLKK